MTEDRDVLAFIEVEGWRYTATNNVGLHKEAESCDLPPQCERIYRSLSGRAQ